MIAFMMAIVTGIISGIISGIMVGEWYRRLGRYKERSELLDEFFKRLMKVVNGFATYMGDRDSTKMKTLLDDANDIALIRQLHRIIRKKDKAIVEDVQRHLIELHNRFRKDGYMHDVQSVADEFGAIGDISMKLHELR